MGPRRRHKGKRGRGTAATDKPPVLGMIARGGKCFLQLCSNVLQATIQPWITTVIRQGSTINTDEYSMYARLPAWGYVHVTVNHGQSRSITVKASMPVMPMGTASTRYTLTPWKVSGACSVLGSAYIVVSHNGHFRSTSASFRRCTTSGNAVSPCSARCFPYS